MTPDPLTPTEANRQLDENGWLDDSHGSGCYALQVTTPPDTPRGVYDRWLAHHDHAARWLLDGLADAVRLAYVGASGDVYGRIQDHCEGDVRQTALLRVFPPVEILGVRACDDPFEEEFNYMNEWTRKGWVVWYDGRLYGL